MTTNTVSATPHQLINGYIVSTIASKPTKLIGNAISRQKNTTSDLFRGSPREASFFVFCIVRIMLSDRILSEDTSVVNIAPAISIPQTHLRLNFSETAKTGIDVCILSARTTVCSIKSIANRNMQINVQDRKISL